MTEITWGDVVRITTDAPDEFRPGELASVCGMHEFPDEGLKYLVEFGDGSSVEIPATFVEILS